MNRGINNNDDDLEIALTPEDFDEDCYYKDDNRYNLTRYNFTVETVNNFVELIKSKNIEEIIFDNCLVEDEGIIAFSNFINRGEISLLRLSIDSSQITDKGLRYLLESIENDKKLKVFVIYSEYPATTKVIENFVRVIKNNALTELDISLNNSDDSIYFPIFEALKINKTLKEMYIGCTITETGSKKILSMLKENLTLERIGFEIDKPLRKGFLEKLLKICSQKERTIIASITKKKRDYYVIGKPMILNMDEIELLFPKINF